MPEARAAHPSVAETLEMVADILAKEQRIITIMTEIKESLEATT